MVGRAAALLLALLLLPLALAACDGGDDGSDETTAATATATGPRPGDGAAAEQAFRAFVAAAARGDADALFDGLTRGSRQRLGPTRAEFARASAASLEGGLGSFEPDALQTVVAEGVTRDWAVVAVQGGDAVFATPMRREQGRWRVDIGGAVSVEPEAPRPGTQPRAPDLRARVDAASRPTVARIWLDGREVPATVGSTGTLSAPLGGLAAGDHTVVVYAQTDEDGAATAWTFGVRGS